MSHTKGRQLFYRNVSSYILRIVCLCDLVANWIDENFFSVCMNSMRSPNENQFFFPDLSFFHSHLVCVYALTIKFVTKIEISSQKQIGASFIVKEKDGYWKRKRTRYTVHSLKFSIIISMYAVIYAKKQTEPKWSLFMHLAWINYKPIWFAVNFS